jgi:hypothetical protein
MKLLNFYAGNDFYIFWVNSADSSSSDIMVRRYYTAEEPVPVVYEGDYNYRNPQLIPIDNWQYHDTLFMLLYEADIDGDFDIYYQFYTLSGFSLPVALTYNDNDDLNMEVSDGGGIVWENNGSIYYTFLNNTDDGEIYFDPAIIIDSILCSRPSISKDGYNRPQYLSWEKIVEDTSRIYLKEYDYLTQDWLDSRIISLDGMNYHPKFSESTESMISPTISWDNVLSDSASMVFYNPDDNFLMQDYKQLLLFNPHVFNIFIGVDWLWDYAILTFENEIQGQIDIFGSTGWYYDYVNISNSGAIDRNPYLFEGVFWGNYEDVINIWESYRNGHWQLFTSLITVPIWGGTSELSQNILDLEADPNPFNQDIKLSFNLLTSGNCKIELMDINGHVVKTLEDYFQEGINEIVLSLPESLPSGLYYVTVRMVGSYKGLKLIKI